MQLSGSELHQINLSLCPFCHIYSLHDPRELHFYTNISHKYTGGFHVCHEFAGVFYHYYYYTSYYYYYY